METTSLLCGPVVIIEGLEADCGSDESFKRRAHPIVSIGIDATDLRDAGKRLRKKAIILNVAILHT